MKYFVHWATALSAVALLALGGPAWAGNLEPPGPPASTMQSLDDIPGSWSRILPANDSTTADGCNSSRFKCVMPTTANATGEAVVDRETGLVWERSPSTTTAAWSSAACTQRIVGNRAGWRLPSIQELASLIDRGAPFPGPRLPPGHPFIGVQSAAGYWSATTGALSATVAWYVLFSFGHVSTDGKTRRLYSWCVRGGPGPDPQ